MTAVSEDILCPLCEYNLRGLVDPRCPECGYTFAWPDLTDPTRRKHRYLFEHHPERNIRAFIRTAIGGLLPRRFWRSLRPEMPSNPRRLILYWLISTFGAALAICALILISLTIYGAVNGPAMRAAIARNAASDPQWAANLKRQFGSVEAYASYEFPTPLQWGFYLQVWGAFRDETEGHRAAKLVLAAMIVWPWLLMAALVLYRMSMRQAKVRAVHVLRCIIYSHDVLLWIVVCGATLLLWQIFDAMRTKTSGTIFEFAKWFNPLAALLMLVSTYRMICAYSLYLKFRHAAATIILTEIAVFLFVMVMISRSLGLWETICLYLYR